MDMLCGPALCAVGGVIWGIITALTRGARSRPLSAPTSGRTTVSGTRYGPSSQEEAMRDVADAMYVSVEEARYIFESVGPASTLAIVKSLPVDPRTEAAASTDDNWWQP